MYLNKVFLYGNLTRDPEIRALPSGQQVASFSIATNRTYKDRDGNKKDATEFHNVVAFGRLADLIGQYMKKGRPIFVEGRIQTRSWDDKNSGEKKYRTEIVIENFQFGPSAPGGQGGAGYGGESAGARPKAEDSDKGGDIEYPQEDISPEDIPF
jgi:single-strand DNA-binding protein